MGNLPVPGPLSLGMYALNLAVGLVLALIVAWYYENYGQSLSNRRKFAHSSSRTRRFCSPGFRLYRSIGFRLYPR